MLLCGTFLLLLGSITANAATPLLDSERKLPPDTDQAPDGTLDSEEREFSATGIRKFRKRLPRPIKLGVSGGNVTDLFTEGDSTFSTSGTLGALVLKRGVPHILSNNHVIARQNEARKGDPVGQPGLVDNRCRDEEEDYVANLSTYKRIRFGGVKNNKVDAAIAEVVAGTVDPQGRIQGIGLPGDTAVEPFLGMQVKKAGRSSGLTRGTVVLLDTTLVVDFGTEENPKRAKFVGQLMVTPNNSTFVEPGDSGSAVFFDSKECPEWVGLLFAGSSDGWGIVTPIKQVFRVLKKLKPRGRVSPIGCSSAAANASSNLMPLEAVAVKRADEARVERQLRAGRRIVERRSDEILALDGVVGLGLGLQRPEAEEVVLHVLVTDTRPETVDKIPAAIDDIQTEIVETGRFRAFDKGRPR
jgi:hypothetical protein